MFHPDLFRPPTIERRAEIPTGTVFSYGGRSLLVTKVYGTDAAAPVIVIEIAESLAALRGQYALWSVDCVSRAMRGRS